METESALNEAQQRHLLVNVEQADSLLSEIEQVLKAVSSKSPFPKYRVDLTPALRRCISSSSISRRSWQERFKRWQER